MVKVRPAMTLPPFPRHRHLCIRFCHPGYNDSNNFLFKLEAPDIDNNNTPGLYAQFAIDACVVITGDTAGRGWLSLHRDGSAPIEPTSTLHECRYYFHLDVADGPYPIVPNFHQWTYPHDQLPSHWQQLTLNTDPPRFVPSDLTTALFLRDGSCRLSACRDQVQTTHIVPQSELEWWMTNNMSRYNKGTTATLDDTANALLLRTDLYIAFNESRFAFVPKPATNGKVRLVPHVLDYSPELEYLYHNNELHLTAVSVDMLYARFAWTIFKLLNTFLAGRTARRLTLRDKHLADARGFVTADGCELFSNAAARKQSKSSKKRKSLHDAATEVEAAFDNPAKRARRDSSSSDCASTVSSSLALGSESLPIAKAWLKKERLRSDPHGLWKKERKWIKEVWAGKTLEASDIGRWLEATGAELRDV